MGRWSGRSGLVGDCVTNVLFVKRFKEGSYFFEKDEIIGNLAWLRILVYLSLNSPISIISNLIIPVSPFI